VVRLAANPEWQHLKDLFNQRLDATHTRLETTQDFKMEQGRAAELRFLLDLEQTAKAILDAESNPKGTRYSA
jgi:hypothetical protein